MKRISALVVTLGIAAASLSSCSRSNYAFNTNTPAYLGSEHVKTEAPAENLTAATVTEAAPLATEATVIHQTSAALAHHQTVAVIAKPEVKAAPVAAATKTHLTRADRKELKSELKRQLAAPKATKAEGKSQLTALLLALFLGGLGIHRFYLGYTGLGILELLTFGVFGILSLIDLIRIIIGDLKPKNGEYAKKL